MNILITVWRAHFKSKRNAIIYDPRVKVATIVLLIFSIILGIWSVKGLQWDIQLWKAQGAHSVVSGLWMMCALTWLSMSFLTVIGVQYNLSKEETAFLFTQPLSSTMRFRVLFSLFVLENLGLLMLLQAIMLGYVLISTLGWYGFSWFLLLELGIVGVALCSLIISLLIIYYFVLHEYAWRHLIIGLASLIGCVFFISYELKLRGELLLLTRPEIICLLLFWGLVVVLGPGARMCGRLYEAAFLALYRKNRVRKAVMLPGVHGLRCLLEQRRGLLSALFAKALVNQSRNWFFWARIVIIWCLLLPFPLLRASLSHYGFTDSALVVGYAPALALGHIIETGPSAISGEASRLTLYLTAPFTYTNILQAKVLLFLLPVLFEGLAMGLILSVDVKLSLMQVGFGILLISLIILGGTCLLVCGSAWDENLNLVVEGMLEAIMQEEAPISPRRILLFNICLIYFMVTVLVLWRFSGITLLVALAFVSGGTAIAMWKFGERQLRLLVRYGW